MQLRLTALPRRLRLHRVDASAPPAPGSPAAKLLDLRRLADEAREARESLQRCCEAIERSVVTVPESVQEQIQQVAALATDMGIAIAREVLGAALDRCEFDPTPVVSRCLRECVDGRGAVQVHLCGADLDRVVAGLESDPQARALVEDVEFSVDGALEPGAVRVRSGAGTLLYDPRVVLERMVAALREELAS